MTKQNLHTEIIALCEYAGVDQNGMLSIDGIFDELKSERFPSGFSDKYLVATINGEPDRDYKLIVQLEKDNNGHNLLNPTVVATRTGSNGKSHLIIKLQVVGFEKEGEYFFKIYDGSEDIGLTRLQVINTKQKQEEVVKILN